LLTEAKAICFLGFGFHHENVKILDLAAILTQELKAVESTRFGISDAEWKAAVSFVQKNRINGHSLYQKCLAALRDMTCFRTITV
jgi:hypothetical protein